MLGSSNAEPLIDEIWDKLPCNVQLPESWGDSAPPTGPTAAHLDDARRYRRFHLRGKAVLEIDGTYLAIYTKDLSRSGLAFYCERQLFPCQDAGVWLADGPRGAVKITRCRRIQEHCYECGADFVK